MIVAKTRLPIVAIVTLGLLPSPLKTWWYRRKGAEIGSGVSFGLGSVVLAKERIRIGADTHIGMLSVIRCARVSIGKRTVIRPFTLIDTEEITIGDDAMVSETALIRALVPSKKSRIVIGNRAHIFPFTMIDTTREVVIGEESAVGYGTYIFTHTAYKSKLDGYPVDFGPVRIGRGVWIPCRVFIAQSVEIGDDAVIGTGAFVARDIPEGVLAAGMPAKVIRTKEQYVAQHSESEKLEMLKDILSEFCGHLQDMGQAQWQVNHSEGRSIWEVALLGRRDKYELELITSPVMAARQRLSVIFEKVSADTIQAWDREKKEWYSIGSHQCSEHLSDIGEEFREFLRRYGLYFARP